MTAFFLHRCGQPKRRRAALAAALHNARLASSPSEFGLNPANLTDPAHQGDTLSYPGNVAPAAGSSDTLRVTYLQPGCYGVEFLSWENTGAAFCDVFAAPGSRTKLDRAVFRLLTSTNFAGARGAGPAQPSGGVPKLAIELVHLEPNYPDGARVSWAPAYPACLQAAPTVFGPWTDVPGGWNGQTFPVCDRARFFRLR